MQDILGNTKLHYAVQKEDDITPLLKQGYDMYIKNLDDETPISLCIKYGTYYNLCDMVDNNMNIEVLYEIDKDGYLLIYYAIQRNYVNMIRLFMNIGYDMKYKDDYGRNAYWYMADKMNLDDTSFLILIDRIRFDMNDYEDLSEDKLNFWKSMFNYPIYPD